MRLTKQQREYQTGVLVAHGLDGEFKPSVRLVNEIASALGTARRVAQERRSHFSVDAKRLNWLQRFACWLMLRDAELVQPELAPWEQPKPAQPATANALPDGTPIPF